MSDEFKVVLEGYNDVKRILAKVDPDLRREMDKTIRDILRPITLKAKSYVPQQPLSGWNYGNDRYAPSRFPFWNPEAVASGIKVLQGNKRTKGSARSTVWRIRNASPPGAVFELMGRGPSTHPIVAAVTKTHGRASRLIWRAWDEAGGEKKITPAVVATIEDYGRVLRTDLNEISRGGK